ncbi:hypothetical protein F5146DRAFT_999325 [Armillaria mellea]|nr:hypothetical protein F5146DRAFT_999325 [Armillaria mellea]
MGKKHELSGLSGVQLSIVYGSLIDPRKTFQPGKSAKADRFEEQLVEPLSLMEARLESPKSFSFSNVTLDILEDYLHIKQVANLRLKEDHEARVEETGFLGEDQLWSSNTLHRHLNDLETVVPQTTASQLRSIHSPLTTDIIFDDPLMASICRILPTGFFVTEAKPGNLRDYIAQAVAEMYVCEAIEERLFARRVDEWHNWIFLILYINPGGIGEAFKQSVIVNLSVSHPFNGPPEVAKPTADLIAGILSFWIEHSFEDLGQDDWFELVGGRSP